MRSEIDDILREAEVCRLALARDGEPYLVPLFFGYDGRCLYFHTAQAGKKLDFIAANDRACFEVERNVRIIPDPANACEWTACFESVVGHGRVIELAGDDKAHGLNQIMRHYSDRDWPYGAAALRGVRVWRIEIETLTGKRSPRGESDLP